MVDIASTIFFEPRTLGVVGKSMDYHAVAPGSIPGERHISEKAVLWPARGKMDGKVEICDSSCNYQLHQVDLARGLAVGSPNQSR